MQNNNSPLNLSYFLYNNLNPYANLALEEYLLWNVEPKECILYLWQNRRTVVIGVNQNPWKECHIKALEEDGGFLARRMSGGGAVFHDTGNMNFTFLAHEADYYVERQLDVIISAVNKLGIKAEKSGRNDIITEGKKFSGNAFYHSKGFSFHHGTILVDVNLSDLSRYLNVSHEKLLSKGVNSVRSRVINLRELAPEITIEMLQNALIETFGEVYGNIPQPFPAERLNHQDLKVLENKYASYDWRFGRKLPFTVEFHKRFTWGDLTLQFYVESGVIRDAVAYSDGMEANFILNMGNALQNIPFSSSDINRKLLILAVTITVDETILKDIMRFVSDNNF